MNTSSRQPLRAGAAYFGWVFGAGFALGAVRVPFIVPRLGERWAELAEMPLMALVIWFAARHVVRRFATPREAGPRLATGAVALVLLMGAELLLSVVLAGRSIGEYLSSRDPVSGTVYLGMLALFALMPWLRARFVEEPPRAASAAD